MQQLLIFIGSVVVVLGLILYSAFSWGFVATIISEWYIIPLFPWFPVLTWKQYAGIMLFINCFFHKYNGENIKDEFKKDRAGIGYLVNPWGVLLVSYILKFFIL